MVVRMVSVLAVVLGLSTNAFAGERTGILHRMSCTMVRYYVALYSASAAEQYARSKGASDAEVEAARHCMKPEAAQTASLAR
ncbi:hypothetical protein SAMN05444158_0548 [Bradyrhizobium canariense]|uniref:Uncharacterized protein n=1 Tax=Bradyrhizobium canariense TaxID=255045 RepID=A0A1H1NAE1_9BRAD|nr:hypothetical protein SAMN05444158_0548 [Bradyrhizobium canariense]